MVSAKGTCCECSRSFVILRSGVLSPHGPIASRCKSSSQPPVESFSSQHSSSEAQESQDVDYMVNARNYVIKRIPKASRHCAATVLTKLLNDVNNENSGSSWQHLLLFASCCLTVPRQRNRRAPRLSILINKQIDSFMTSWRRPVSSIFTNSRPDIKSKDTNND